MTIAGGIEFDGIGSQPRLRWSIGEEDRLRRERLQGDRAAGDELITAQQTPRSRLGHIREDSKGALETLALAQPGRKFDLDHRGIGGTVAHERQNIDRHPGSSQPGRRRT